MKYLHILKLKTLLPKGNIAQFFQKSSAAMTAIRFYGVEELNNAHGQSKVSFSKFYL